ncbi:MAG TPA: hypothetical protein VIC62_16555 [Nakamurella sp.]
MFSVHQSDVIYYGADLADYLRREFDPGTHREPSMWGYVRFWSDLACGAESGDL